MKKYLLILIFVKLVFTVQYNKLCTFSFGTCDWSIGRRWHIINFDNEDKVLIADAESKEDKRTGFTDAIMSSWLHLSPLCSFDIRLTFKYNIENKNDFIEIYFIEKNRTRMNSLGQWKNLENNKTIWQQGNITFKASEEFRIDFQIRHLPDKNNDSTVWFAIDDILIENCPTAIVNISSSTTYQTTEMTTTILSTTKENTSTLFNISSLKSNENEFPSSTFIRQNLLTLILYLLCALIAFTLLIILFSIIIFTYRKHCLPLSSSSLSSSPIIDHQYRIRNKKLNNRIGIQIENSNSNSQNRKTIDNNVRPCFE